MPDDHSRLGQGAGNSIDIIRQVRRVTGQGRPAMPKHIKGDDVVRCGKRVDLPIPRL